MTFTFELPFDFLYNTTSAPQQLHAPYPPFNSGTWNFTATYPGQVTLDCKDCLTTIAVTSAKLVTSCPAVGARSDASADSGVCNAKFPPSPNWSLTATARNCGHQQYVARLVMQLPWSATIDEPVAASVKALARRNASK